MAPKPELAVDNLPTDPTAADPVKKNSERVTAAQKASVDEALSALIAVIRADDNNLQTIARPFHAAAVNVGAKQVAELVGLDALLSIDDPRIAKILGERKNQIVSVNQTTADKIVKAIAAAMQDGETPEQIADAIAAVYEARNAETIARQEVGSALNAGRYAQMADEEIPEHEWVTSHDARVRPTHEDLDGEMRELGAEFSNGLEYPQDPEGPPDEVINCRCITLPVIDVSKSSTTLDRAAHWRATMREVAPIEEKFAVALAHYFDEQRKRVTTRWETR